MLTNIAVAPASKKQITYSGNTAGAIYTVPAGKTFTGWFSTASGSGGLAINGSTFYAMTGTAGGVPIPQPVILLAGTVVTGISAQVSFIGIEE